MCWSLVVRASMRWVVVGTWCGWSVMVGDGFSFGDRVFLLGLCGGVFVVGE